MSTPVPPMPSPPAQPPADPPPNRSGLLRGLRIAGWVLTGGLWVFSLLSILSIGIFVMPVALGLTAALLLSGRRPDRAAVGGLIAGLGVPVLWIAWLNRHGPGDYCTVTPTMTSCEQQWSPWPWLAAGILLIAIGSVLARRRPI